MRETKVATANQMEGKSDKAATKGSSATKSLGKPSAVSLSMAIEVMVVMLLGILAVGVSLLLLESKPANTTINHTAEYVYGKQKHLWQIVRFRRLQVSGKWFSFRTMTFSFKPRPKNFTQPMENYEQLECHYTQQQQQPLTHPGETMRENLIMGNELKMWHDKATTTTRTRVLPVTVACVNEAQTKGDAAGGDNNCGSNKGSGKGVVDVTVVVRGNKDVLPQSSVAKLTIANEALNERNQQFIDEVNAVPSQVKNNGVTDKIRSKSTNDNNSIYSYLLYHRSEFPKKMTSISLVSSSKEINMQISQKFFQYTNNQNNCPLNIDSNSIKSALISRILETLFFTKLSKIVASHHKIFLNLR